MPATNDPYEKWLGIRASEHEVDHYQLLGLPRFESDQSTIEEALQDRLRQIHSSAAPNQTKLAEAISAEILAAYNVLASPTVKSAYDRSLRDETGVLAHTIDETPTTSADERNSPKKSYPSPRLRKSLFASSVIALIALVPIGGLFLTFRLFESSHLSAGASGIDASTIHPNDELMIDGAPSQQRADAVKSDDPARHDRKSAKHKKHPGHSETNPKKTEDHSAKTKKHKTIGPNQVELGDGSVITLETYGDTYQGYDWRPHLTLDSPELEEVLDFRKLGEQKVLRGWGTMSLKFDVANDRMYWCTFPQPGASFTGKIQSSYLDGSHPEDVVVRLECPRQLTLDLKREKIFWTEVKRFSGQNWVKKSRLDGSDVETIVPGAHDPLGIDLDPRSGDVFFWEREGRNRHIHRIRPDGSGETSIIERGQSMNVCLNLIVDTAAEKLYWISHDQRVWQANLEGSEPEVLMDVFAQMISFSYDPTERKFYWIDSSMRLRRSNRDGSQVETLIAVPPRKQNLYTRFFKSVAVLPEMGLLYVASHYNLPGDWMTYDKTDRLKIPPLLQPVTKPAPPLITSITPDKQSPGGDVIVNGTGFTGVMKVALFDDGSGGEVPVDFKKGDSDNQLVFRMPQMGEKCHHAAIIVQTNGGVTVTLPKSLSVVRPRIWNSGREQMQLEHVKKVGQHSNIWYVVGQHETRYIYSQATRTQIGLLNWSLAYVEPHGIATPEQRGHNVFFVKDGGMTTMAHWRSVVYHEPFAILQNLSAESPEEMDTKYIPVPAIRPSFVQELLEYDESR